MVEMAGVYLSACLAVLHRRGGLWGVLSGVLGGRLVVGLPSHSQPFAGQRRPTGAECPGEQIGC